MFIFSKKNVTYFWMSSNFGVWAQHYSHRNKLRIGALLIALDEWLLSHYTNTEQENFILFSYFLTIKS